MLEQKRGSKGFCLCDISRRRWKPWRWDVHVGHGPDRHFDPSDPLVSSLSASPLKSDNRLSNARCDALEVDGVAIAQAESRYVDPIEGWYARYDEAVDSLGVGDAGDDDVEEDDGRREGRVALHEGRERVRSTIESRCGLVVEPAHSLSVPIWGLERDERRTKRRRVLERPSRRRRPWSSQSSRRIPC